MLLFYLVMIITAFLFVTTLTDNRQDVLVGIAIIILAYRSNVGQNQLHHILYYMLGHVCLLGIMAMTFRLLLRDDDNQRAKIGLVIYSVWSGANGGVTVVLSALPVIVSLIFIVTISSEYWNRTWKCMLWIAGAVLTGLLLNKFAMRGIQDAGYIEGSGTLTLQSIPDWVIDLRKLPEDWFRMFVLFDPKGKKILSLAGLETLFSAFYALGVGLLPFLFAFLVRVKNRSIAEHMIFSTDIMIWIICLMQYVFLRGAEIRMLLSGVLIHFVLLCVWYLRHDAITETAYDSSSSGFQHFQMPVRLWFRAFVSVVVALYAMCFAVKTNWTIDKSLTDELYQNGLDYGFATYWNANFYTVHSSNQVKIRPVVIEKNRVKSKIIRANRNGTEKNKLVTKTGLFYYQVKNTDCCQKVMANNY